MRRLQNANLQTSKPPNLQTSKPPSKRFGGLHGGHVPVSEAASSPARLMSQLSDISMGDASMPTRTDSQLERDATELLAADPTNDRLEDALASDAVEQPTSMGPPAQPANPQPDAGSERADGADDATGNCDSSNGPSSGDEEDAAEEAGAPADLAGLMEAGGNLISRFASQSQASQMTDDGDYEKERIREDFAKIKTSTWIQKKLDKTTRELDKLVKQHENSKKGLVAPVKELIEMYPEKKKPLTLMSGLLSDACTDGDLREAIISAANVLKSQVKMVEQIKENMKIIEVGGICLEEKKKEEEKKRGQSSTTMSAAAALLAGASSSKKPRRK